MTVKIPGLGGRLISKEFFRALEERFKFLALVVREVDNAIHRINHYPADSVVCFVNTYPLGNNWGLDFYGSDNFFGMPSI